MEWLISPLATAIIINSASAEEHPLIHLIKNNTNALFGHILEH